MRKLLFVLISICVQKLTYGNEHVAGNQCPRFHVQEFYASLFRPLFDRQIPFIQTMLQVSTDGAEEMLIKIEEKKGTNGEKTRAGTTIISITFLRSYPAAKI